MKSTLLWLSVLSIFFSLTSIEVSACDIYGRTGFLPENKLKIPVGIKSMGGLSQDQFNQVMDKMLSLYSGLVAKRGAQFAIDRRWSDPTVNAYAHQNTPGVYTIVMFGGLARHPEVTPDAMALVACHELGHHLGGAPKKVSPGNWAANEGQADYWGTMKCLRQYFQGENQQLALKNMTIPAVVNSNCEARYSNTDEQLICKRMAMAGAALAKLLNAVSNDSVASNYTTPDKSIVSKTFDDHPKTQCRMDTFFQASLCDHTIAESDSDTDANIGVCSIRNGDKIGNRPLCWFKPN